MSITELTLKNFSLFHDARFTFSPGLNVLIGAKRHRQVARYEASLRLP